jgi:hypothetical protein
MVSLFGRGFDSLQLHFLKIAYGLDEYRRNRLARHYWHRYLYQQEKR